jgi:hypothetical protein
LFIASNATAIRFNFAEELHRLQQAHKRAPKSYTVKARWSVSRESLDRLLQEERPQLVHLLSPGVNPANDGLMLDRGGKIEYVKPAELGKIFGKQTKSPKLVFLNTCHSWKHALAIAPHVGAVIAMKDVIYDHTAIELAAEFYAGLTAGLSVGDAFERGREAVGRVTPEQREVPILIPGTADPAGITFAPVAAKQRARTRTPAEKPAPLMLFCSYAHQDEKFRSQLESHLALLSQQKAIQVWHDRRIEPGANWKKEIDDNLDRAQIVLLLVSADFLSSQYCMGIEMKRALARQESGETRVIPILIRTCDLEGAPFGGLQWLPTGSKPVKSWSDRDAAWTDVAKGVRLAVTALSLDTGPEAAL